jgi:hypothetical protein
MTLVVRVGNAARCVARAWSLAGYRLPRHLEACGYRRDIKFPSLKRPDLGQYL